MLFYCLSLLYLIFLLGNGLIIILMCIDYCLHTPMYFFLSHIHSECGLCHQHSIPNAGTSGLQEDVMNWMNGCPDVQFPDAENHWILTFCNGGLWQVCGYLPSLRYSLHEFFVVWVNGGYLWILGYHLLIILPYCVPNEINHFFCEVPAVLKLACVDTYQGELHLELHPSVGPTFPHQHCLHQYLCCYPKESLCPRGTQGLFPLCLPHHHHVLYSIFGYVNKTWLWDLPIKGQKAGSILQCHFCLPQLHHYSLRN